MSTNIRTGKAIGSDLSDLAGATLPTAVSAPAPATIGRTHRSVNLDRFRVLAIVEIVAFHINTNAERLFFGFGLPFFLITTVALSCSRSEPELTAPFLRKRIIRLMLPWLAWSLIYLMAITAKAHLKHVPIGDLLSWRMLLYGTATHLWFIPFAFGAGVFAHIIHKTITPTSRASAASMMAIATLCLLLASTYFPVLRNAATPYQQWAFALPALPLGIAIGFSMSRSTVNRLVILISLTFVVASTIGLIAMTSGDPHLAVRYLLALTVIAACLIWPGTKNVCEKPQLSR